MMTGLLIPNPFCSRNKSSTHGKSSREWQFHGTFAVWDFRSHRTHSLEFSLHCSIL